jgi:LPS export ABC transporter protein LptC
MGADNKKVRVRMNVTNFQKVALILALFALAIFSWSQIYFRAENARGISSKTSPKFFIENAQVQRFNAAGRLEFTLNADTVLGSEDGTSFRMTRPRLVHITASHARGATSADLGEMRQRDELDLHGNVTFSFIPPDKRPKTAATTTSAHVNLKTGLVTSNQPANFTRGTLTGRGVGFSYDNEKGLLMINSDVLLTLIAK